MALKINSYVKWNFNIVGVEPLQFGIYPEGGFYDWHMDEHPENDRRGYRRKISMSLFLMRILKEASLIWRYINQEKSKGLLLSNPKLTPQFSF